MLDPPTGEWPVFPTSHAPSLYQVAREIIGNEADLSDIDVDELLREHECPPPSITVDASRRRIKKMCEAAGIEIDGEYLKLHGARRGIGHKLFEKDRGEAQDLLGHQSPETTKQAYSDRVAEERSGRVSDLLDE
ncbi:Phage integrase family protein [Halogranum amylolyticum]|uniref:Phage integrase family protein n=1 Tax=Halogranum amylolyticum TaxID=660520 RepID=A0A1H8WBA8_9EURY|nr:tyrosine-type recombinase/integrase [Halogranum amylolyticum]SEP24952.1 Phage integrase family protein [Halogranum amylolyticum]